MTTEREPADAERHLVTDYIRPGKEHLTSRFTGKAWAKTVERFMCPRCDEITARPGHGIPTKHDCGLRMVAYGNSLYLWDDEDTRS